MSEYTIQKYSYTVLNLKPLILRSVMGYFWSFNAKSSFGANLNPHVSVFLIPPVAPAPLHPSFIHICVSSLFFYIFRREGRRASNLANGKGQDLGHCPRPPRLLRPSRGLRQYRILHLYNSIISKILLAS